MKKIILPLFIASTFPFTAIAQVPTAPVRPGLNLNQPGAVSAPGYTTADNMTPTTNLVQHQYGAAQTPPQASSQPQQSQQDFFYVDPNSQGPQKLATGLSDYNTKRMDQTASQLQGNYGDVQANGAMPSGTIQNAWNRPFDNMSAGQSAPGTVRYQWTADLVMPVRLRQGMTTSIILPNWEAAQDVLIGDGSTVEAKILRPNQVAVKAVRVGADTSLSIVGGSGNVYTFYLRTEGDNTTKITDLQVFVQAAPSKGSNGWFNNDVQNAYQKPGAAVQNVSASGDNGSIVLPGAASQGSEPVPSDRRIFNMKMYEVHPGDRVIAPEYVYNDGRFTYLHYPPGVTDRPAVFRVVDGVEGRVNTRVAGRNSEDIVIEAVGDFVLRSGTRAVCIKTVDSQDQPVNGGH